MHFVMANAQVRVRFVESVRGGRSLYYAKNKFRLNRHKGDTTYWQCTEAGCSARIVTTGDRVQSATLNHNHPEPDFIFEVDEFKLKLINRAKTEVTPIPQIYDDEIANLRKHADVVPDGLLRVIPRFSAVKTGMYRQRHKTIPALPTSRQDITLEGEWAQTDSGEQFLHTVGDGEPILIFTTNQNMELFCDADVVYGDGTFSSSTKLFDQIYTFHAEAQGHMFPLIYCLLPNRTEATYIRTLK